MISDERSGEKREKSFFFLAFYIYTENLCFVLLCYNNYTCPLFWMHTFYLRPLYFPVLIIPIQIIDLMLNKLTLIDFDIIIRIFCQILGKNLGINLDSV